MNIDTLFIDCLKLPVFARGEYLESEQAESRFSKATYLKILYHKWKEYKGIEFKCSQWFFCTLFKHDRKFQYCKWGCFAF